MLSSPSQKQRFALAFEIRGKWYSDKDSESFPITPWITVVCVCVCVGFLFYRHNVGNVLLRSVIQLCGFPCTYVPLGFKTYKNSQLPRIPKHKLKGMHASYNLQVTFCTISTKSTQSYYLKYNQMKRLSKKTWKRRSKETFPGLKRGKSNKTLWSCNCDKLVIKKDTLPSRLGWPCGLMGGLGVR